MMMSDHQVDEWIGKSKFAEVRNFSIAALNVSTRKLLGRSLDIECNNFSKKNCVQQDWQGLAELMGLNYADIQELHHKSEKTVYLLDQWATGSNRTIGLLLDYLEDMERFDILEDDILQRRILLDVDRFIKQQEAKKREHNIVPPPVQVQEVDSQLQSSSSDPRCSENYQETLENEFKNITIGEIETGKPEFFDAFICYTSADIYFVKQMINMLENVHGLKLCIADRDLTAGSAKNTVMSYLISKRCNKMVVILSQEYLRSPECDFMTKFGHALAPGARSKKLIPVLIERFCPIPDILRFITLVDYTKCELVEWFWCRLARSLQETSLTTSLLFSPSAVQQANEQAQEQRLMEAQQASAQASQYAAAAAAHGGGINTQPIRFNAPSPMDSGFGDEASMTGPPSFSDDNTSMDLYGTSSSRSASLSSLSSLSSSPLPFAATAGKKKNSKKSSKQQVPKLDVKKGDQYKFF